MSSNIRRFEKLLEPAPDALVGMDREGVIQYVDRQTEVLFGFDRDQLIGQRIETLVPEFLGHDYVKHRDDYLTAPKTKSSGLDLVLSGRQREGSEFPVNIRLFFIDTVDVLLVITAVHAAAQRKQTVEGAQRMASIIEHSDDAIIGRTLDGIITSWNPAAERMFGYASAEIVGKSADLLNPRDRAGEAIAVVTKVRVGKPVEHLEAMRVRKNGTEFPVSLTISPIRNDGGGVVGLSVICRDQTELKRAERYARGMIEADPDPLGMVSSDGTVMDVNEATVKATGFSRDELIGSDFSQYFTDPDLAREGVERAFTQGSLTDRRLTVRHRDGTLTDFLCNASVYRDINGEVLGVLTSARDITEQKKAFEAAQHMAAIVEFSGEAIFGRTLEGIITSWNPAAERMFGYSSEEIVGKSVGLLIPEDRAAETKTVVAKVNAGQPVEELETIRVRKDGRLFPVSLTVSPICDVGGAVVGASVISRDVTELKGALAVAQRLASIVEYSDDAILSGSLEGMVTSWNPAAERMFGYSSEEIVGRSASILTPPDRAGEIETFLAKIIAGQHVKDYETQRVRKDGTVFPISLTVSPVRDADGAVSGTSVIYRDLSGLKKRLGAVQREQAERFSRQRLDRILTLTPAVIFVIDDTNGWTPKPMSGKVEDLFGYGQSRFSEGSAFWDEIVHPHDGDVPLAPKAPILGAGRYQCEYRFRHGDGSWRWLNEQVLVRPVEDGKPPEVIGSWTDITESRATLEALRISDEQRQELLIELAAAHEEERTHLSRELHDNLGQILTSASLFAKAASDDIPPERRELHDKVRSLIDDALASTRSLVWTLRRSPRSNSLETRLQQLVEDVRADTSVKVHLTFRAHAGSVSLSAEFVVFRVVQEALTNVMRHAQAGNAWILLTATGTRVEVVIWDDGIGFDTSATLTSGSHAGLLGMQERASSLGGMLTIGSRPGHGTTVRLDLPADGNAM